MDRSSLGTYSVHFLRFSPPAHALAKNIQVSAGAELVGGFAMDVFNYTVVAGYKTRLVNFTVEGNDALTSIRVDEMHIVVSCLLLVQSFTYAVWNLNV